MNSHLNKTQKNKINRYLLILKELGCLTEVSHWQKVSLALADCNLTGIKSDLINEIQASVAAFDAFFKIYPNSIAKKQNLLAQFCDKAVLELGRLTTNPELYQPEPPSLFQICTHIIAAPYQSLSTQPLITVPFTTNNDCSEQYIRLLKQQTNKSLGSISNITDLLTDKEPSKKAIKSTVVQEQETKVKSKLLDNLIGHSEELVQIRNELADLAERMGQQQLSEISHKLVSISDNILNDLLKTRMRPIGYLLKKYKRIVRDLAGTLDKKVNLTIRGENIELDQNVIEALHEPLIHIIRNAIDHGIESPTMRGKLGKAATAHLLIHAYNADGKVKIRINDDGRGIDTDKLVQKAISRGIVKKNEAERWSETEKLNLIFHAGLSTRDQVNELSGRGVGMDAVKRKVEEIKGEIHLASEANVGTEVIMTFPLTMATLKVALLDINGTRYAVPSSEIDQIICVSKTNQDTEIRFDCSPPLLSCAQQVIPLILPETYLSDHNADRLLLESYEQKLRTCVVIFSSNGQKYGLWVSELNSLVDVVIKPVEDSMNSKNILNGVAVLGSGELGLVLNVSKIRQLASKNSHTRYN